MLTHLEFFFFFKNLIFFCEIISKTHIISQKVGGCFFFILHNFIILIFLAASFVPIHLKILYHIDCHILG